jgi:hypothetical protein
MTLPFTPFDLALLLFWAAVVVLAAQCGISGLFVGVVGPLLLRPLLLLAEVGALPALAAALMLGLLLALSVRPFPRLSYRQPRWGHLLGALGGVFLGGALVLALLVSLPLGRDLNGAVRYPAADTPFAAVIQRSRSGDAGRAILLYPLLESSGQVAPEQRGVLSVLHSLFVVGQPWREG